MYRHTQRRRETMTTVYIKSGMPVDVEGDVVHSGSNSYGSDEPACTEVESIEIYWHGSTRPVTAKFKASITKADWDTIHESLIEAAAGW